MHSASSPNRRRPAVRAERIAPVQRLPISSIPAWKWGQTVAADPPFAAGALAAFEAVACVTGPSLTLPRSLPNVSDGPAGQPVQGPVSTAPPRAARVSAGWTISFGTANPPALPLVVAAKTVPRTRPAPSTIGAPELPLRTLPRSEEIWRLIGPRPYASW